MQRRTKRVFTYKTRWSALLRTQSTLRLHPKRLRTKSSRSCEMLSATAQPIEINQDHKNYTTKLCLKVETVERRIKDNFIGLCVTGSSPEETKLRLTSMTYSSTSEKHQRLQPALCVFRTYSPLWAHTLTA